MNSDYYLYHEKSLIPLKEVADHGIIPGDILCENARGTLSLYVVGDRIDTDNRFTKFEIIDINDFMWSNLNGQKPRSSTLFIPTNR